MGALMVAIEDGLGLLGCNPRPTVADFEDGLLEKLTDS
jgi:hypothetical protein